jgi:hypothetical protein
MRDSGGRVDYRGVVSGNAVGLHESTSPSLRFPAYHVPNKVNAIADFESYYGFVPQHDELDRPRFLGFLDEDLASRLRADSRVRRWPQSEGSSVSRPYRMRRCLVDSVGAVGIVGGRWR